MTRDPADQVEYRTRAARIVPRLLDAAPSLRARWQTYLAYWDGRSGGDYIDMAEVAHHLVEQLHADATDEFPAVFGAVEALLADDDDVIEEIITVGLLEDLQNIAANESGWLFARRFRTWLGPLATARWDLLHRDWGTAAFDPPAAGDIREH